MNPKKESELIEKNLRQAKKDGELKGSEFNSTFIELWYWKRHHNVKILVNGEEHGIGWLARNLPNIETIRVIWSHIRNEKEIKPEEQDDNHGTTTSKMP